MVVFASRFLISSCIRGLFGKISFDAPRYIRRLLARMST